MMQHAITRKYPVRDYLRVGAMLFVIALAFVAIKLIGFLSRSEDKGLWINAKKHSFSSMLAENAGKNSFIG